LAGAADFPMGKADLDANVSPAGAFGDTSSTLIGPKPTRPFNAQPSPVFAAEIAPRDLAIAFYSTSKPHRTAHDAAKASGNVAPTGSSPMRAHDERQDDAPRRTRTTQSRDRQQSKRHRLRLVETVRTAVANNRQCVEFHADEIRKTATMALSGTGNAVGMQHIFFIDQHLIAKLIQQCISLTSRNCIVGISIETAATNVLHRPAGMFAVVRNTHRMPAPFETLSPRFRRKCRAQPVRYVAL
jgi:hypothetical protein